MPRTDPHSYFDQTQGVIEQIDFAMKLDFDFREIHGSAAYKLAAQAAGPLDLDTRSLSIASVKTAGGQEIPWKLAETEGFMGAKLTLELPPGTDGFSIAFTTPPGSMAMQWLEPGNTAGGKLPFLFSQCQPIHARAIFPCQDSPTVRFAYTAELDVPEALTPVMSAAPGIEKSRGDGRAVHRFEMPQPIPSYLFALAVGNLSSRDLGPRSRVYAEPETLDAAAHEFAEADDMLQAAEGLFGPYLWERFDFVVMPPAFPYGGMENPRLTFLTPTLLAGDRSLTNVLAHELAHSWTGNLVTNATMNDFWLNEGFTVWAERRILERLENAEAVSLSAAIGRAGLDEAVEQFGADSPLTRLETDLAGTDPDEVYSLVPYEKGFLFVARLEELLGREDMDAFILQYIERFKFVSITTAEFEAFVEEVRPGLLERMGAKQWIHGEGVPDNAPVFESPKLGELKGLAAGWKDGARPSAEQLGAWSAAETLVYMGELPREMSATECDELFALFDLENSNNAEILFSGLIVAATSAHEPAFAKLGEFLGSVGRMKFLKPLFAALAKNEGTMELARKIYADNKDKYHPIARGGLEKILA